jgi:hypothetical protein
MQSGKIAWIRSSSDDPTVVECASGPIQNAMMQVRIRAEAHSAVTGTLCGVDTRRRAMAKRMNIPAGAKIGR